MGASYEILLDPKRVRGRCWLAGYYCSFYALLVVNFARKKLSPIMHTDGKFSTNLPRRFFLVRMRVTRER